jgi:DNA-directed RNA polymerase beta subunit
VVVPVISDGFEAMMALSEEEAKSRVEHAAEILDDLRRQRPYTHCEIDPMATMGIAAAIIPYANHNQGPRNVFQAAMGKQSLGIIHANHMNRTDGRTKMLAFPTRPLFEPQMNELFGLNDLPQGEMCIIAFVTTTGYTQEDAFVANQAAIDLGKFRMFKYMVYTTVIKSDRNVREMLGRPKLKPTENPDHYQYIGDNGLPAIGAPLRQGDCITGKIQHSIASGEVRNDSTFLKIGEEGIVDMVRVTTDDETTVVTIKVRMMRIPGEGDKFAPRYAQKGTIGLVLPKEDMPWGERSGIVPDLLVNPHSIASRMTMGYLMEMLAGKHAAMRGERVNATSFRPFEFDEFRQTLRHYGYNEMGYEILRSGTTGERIGAQIFMGPVYFQALKHHVADKIQARSRGAVKPMTHQPARGRSVGGGLRFGEMERDSVIAHGASAFLKERLCTLSDAYQTVFCKTCGTFAIADTKTATYKCRFCGDKGSFGRATIPYAYKLLTHLLAAPGLFLRLEMATEEEYRQRQAERNIQARRAIEDAATRDIERIAEEAEEYEQYQEGEEEEEEAEGGEGDGDWGEEYGDE